VNEFLRKKNGKKTEKNPQESRAFLFFSPKNKFLSNRNYQPSFRLAVYRSWRRQRQRQRQGRARRRRRVVADHWGRGEGGRGR
jgi:hypothetical protein